jgi:hypothetical protein
MKSPFGLEIGVRRFRGNGQNHRAPVAIDAASTQQSQLKLCSHNLDAEVDREVNVPG